MPHASARISPTAHYTGYTWLAHGLSHPALATPSGRFLYRALRPANRLLRAAGKPNLDGMLLARHRLIDAALIAAVERGDVSQVIEVASGLSPRGWRFARDYGDQITYVEADLPGMAATKRAALGRIAGAGARPRVVELDATADAGPTSLAALVDTLDPRRGTAIVTEGLLNYFEPVAVARMWRRFAGALARFPRGLYLADLHLADAAGPVERLFAGALGVFVRGRVHFHFADAAAAARELAIAGFATAALDDPAAAQLPELDRASARFVRIVRATTGG
ncbi:MAG: class I SAM-dependent methyltransferase [Kofleriaceae bacterium]